MNLPLALGVNVAELIARARREHRPLNIDDATIDLFLRYFELGFSRQEIAETIESEAEAAGVVLLE